MHLLARTTLIAALLAPASVLVLTVSVARVMHLASPPDDFASWPAVKKEVFFSEHRPDTLSGFALLKTWLNEPGSALPYVGPPLALAFSLSWIAALFGAIWQKRSRR